MWTLFEPVHVVTYFAAEARSAFEEAGLRGFWRGYFAGRAAPLGAVGGGAGDRLVLQLRSADGAAGRCPAVWDLITPAEALAVRPAGAVAALRRLLAAIDTPQVEQPPPTCCCAATDGLDCAGRVLAAANAALPVPDEPVARLWHAATLLREHRGDGHFAALARRGYRRLRGAGAAGGRRPGPRASCSRCAAGPTRTGSGGGPAGRPGLAGRRRHAHAGRRGLPGRSRRTHRRAAARPWARPGADASEELARLLAPIAQACAAELPYPNPVGVPAPAVSGSRLTHRRAATRTGPMPTTERPALAELADRR